MAFRLLLDTDVLADFTLKGPGYAISRQLMEWAVKGRIQIFITPVILQKLSRLLREAYGEDQAKELLLALLSEVRVVDMGHETVVSALHSKIGNMEDAMQYYTALHHKLDYYISRETGLQSVATTVLPVCSPEEFVNNNQ